MILALIGLISDWFLRGGGWKSALYKNKPPFDIGGEDWYHGAIYGFCFAWVTDWRFGLLAGLCMVAGATPSISPKYTTLQMSSRNLWWSFCLSVATVIAAYFLPIHLLAYLVAINLAGALMGPFYRFYAWVFTKIKPNYVFNGWTCAEMTRGFLFFGCLTLI